MKSISVISFVVLAFAFLMFSACKKEDLPKGAPECLQDLIKELKNDDNRSKPKIYQAEYQGNTVYYVPAKDCCDFFSDLYNESCAIICHPDGGIGGNGDGLCSDFTLDGAEVIWEE